MARARGRAALFWRRYRAPYLFISPFFLIFILFQLYPMLQSLVYSFMDYDGLKEPRFIGLDNYRLLFSRDTYAFWDTLRNTFFYWIVCSAAVVALAVAVAMLLNYRGLKGRGFFKTVAFLPYVCASVAVALIFNMLFDLNTGVINEALSLLGLEPVGWLTTSAWARIPVVVLFTWRCVPWYTMIVLSGLLNIPNDYYEAATVDGATFLQQFWRITLPSLGNILFFCLITVTCDVWKMFNEPYVMKGPAYSNASLFQYMYENAFTTFRLGYASAIGYVLAVILFVVSIVQFRLRRSEEGLV